MSRLNNSNGEFYDPLIVKGLKYGVLSIAALAANLVVDEDMQTMLNIIPTAARDVTFPAPSAANEGMFWYVNNIAATALDLTIKNSAGSGIGTISQNELGVVYIAGGVTYCRVVGLST